MTNEYLLSGDRLCWTGTHAAALLIAMVVLSGKDRHSEPHIGLIESFGCYWHLVDILWLVIFPLLYLVH